MDKRIKKAIDLIFRTNNYDLTNVNEGIRLLEEVREDTFNKIHVENSYIHDASFLLSFIYASSGYDNEFLDIKKDDDLAKKYLIESIKNGSSLATIGALNMKLLSVVNIKKLMKFETLKDAYVDVLDRAEKKDGFCQYIIAEIYYNNNIYLIDNTDRKDIKVSVQREMKRMCSYWYEKAMEEKIYIGFINHAHMYMEYDAVCLQDEKSFRNILERVCNKGYIDGKIAYAMYLYKKQEYKEAKVLFEELLSLGYKKANTYLIELDEIEKSAHKFIPVMIIRKKISKIISKIN